MQYLFTISECLAAEKYWISFYQTNVSRYPFGLGYNLTDGGDTTTLGLKWSDNSKKSFSVATLGEKNNSAKLTNDQVVEIKTMMMQDFSNKEIAEKFGMASKEIWEIRNGSRWGHIIIEIDSKEKSESIKRNGHAKLTTEQVREIKILLSQNNGVSKISKQLHIPISTINAIKLGITWKHIIV